jgi:GNAT superfamily N-acetyltransferase
MVTVRPPTAADTAAYRGHMPDDYLDGLRAEERSAGWERYLRLGRARTAVLVAEQAGGVTGFASVGPAEDPEGTGELYAINVDPAHWGTGAGRARPPPASVTIATLPSKRMSPNSDLPAPAWHRRSRVAVGGARAGSPHMDRG